MFWGSSCKVSFILMYDTHVQNTCVVFQMWIVQICIVSCLLLSNTCKWRGKDLTSTDVVIYKEKHRKLHTSFASDTADTHCSLFKKITVDLQGLRKMEIPFTAYYILSPFPLPSPFCSTFFVLLLLSILFCHTTCKVVMWRQNSPGKGLPYPFYWQKNKGWKLAILLWLPRNPHSNHWDLLS